MRPNLRFAHAADKYAAGPQKIKPDLAFFWEKRGSQPGIAASRASLRKQQDFEVPLFPTEIDPLFRQIEPVPIGDQLRKEF
jgi:hypothetical protein